MKRTVFASLTALMIASQASAGPIVFDLPTLWFPADSSVTTATSSQDSSDDK